MVGLMRTQGLETSRPVWKVNSTVMNWSPCPPEHHFCIIKSKVIPTLQVVGGQNEIERRLAHQVLLQLNNALDDTEKYC